MKDTPLLFWVISGKNAYQAFFMLFLLFSGVSIVLGPATTHNALYAALPAWTVTAFGAALAVSALLNLISVYWPGRAETGIKTESASSLMIAWTCFAFAALAAHFPVQPLNETLSSIGLTALLGIFALGRWRQCRKAIKEITQFKSALEAMGRDD